MHRLSIKKIIAVITILIFLLLVPSAVAADFSAGYKILYDVDAQGTAAVTQEITLTNHTPDRYIADYTMTNSAQKPEQVSAWSQSGQLETQIETQANSSTLKILLGYQTAGQNKQTKVTLTYSLPGFAEKKGRIWEVVLPRLEMSLPLSDLQTTLQVPRAFGAPQFFLPAPSEVSHDETRQTFHLTDIDAQDVTAAAFGNYQLFSFTLQYRLNNPLDAEALMEIALPPDLPPTQKLFLKELTPAPKQITTDTDGNYLAAYQLKPKGALTVTYRGQAQVKILSGGNFDTGAHARYTHPDKNWESNDEKITTIVAEQLTAEMTNLQKAEKLYDFVVGELQYNARRFEEQEVQRLGAVEALAQKDNAVCMEFTDLLVALLRAANIPARELDGFAYSPNKDVSYTGDILHSWVQFYDDANNNWRQVDPTWEDTSGRDYFSALDLDHFIFAVKGMDSERPYPAGCYKDENEPEAHDVEVNFAEARESGTIPFTLWRQQWEASTRKPSLLERIFTLIQKVRARIENLEARS